MTIDFQLLGAIGLCIAVISLAWFAMLHNPKAQVNRRFGVMALVTAGWTLAISLALADQNPVATIWLGKIGFAFASSIPFTLIWMVDSLSEIGWPTRRLTLTVPGFFCLVFVSASFGPWIVAGALPGIPRSNFVYGPFHRWFGIYFLLCFAAGVYMLWRAARRALGITRVQLRYLLLGISLTGAGAITTNLLIPLIGRTSKYSVLGPYFSLLFFSFSTHAIIRHRLMNIRLVVRRGIVYLLAALVAGGVFATFLGFASLVMGQRRQDVPLATEVEVLVALIIALVFQPLKGWIQSWMDRYLYRESYNYQQILREASRIIGSSLDLQVLLGYVGDLARRTCRPEVVAIYVREAGTGQFHLHTHLGSEHSAPDSFQKHLLITDALPTFLATVRRPVLREELERPVESLNVHEAAQQLSSLRGDFVLPMFSEYELLGVIVLGPKLSGDAYFNEDIELLSTLANQAAISVKNASLYRQVVLVNEYIENILRTMDSGVITISASGNVVLSNSTAERLTRMPSDALRHLTVEGLPEGLATQLKATLSDGQPRLQTETTLFSSGDRRIPLVSSSSALKDDRGRIIGALVVFSDLSNVKALENEKRRAERLASLGTLVSGIAHEIKNPLVAIKTFAELLPERFTDADFRDDFSGVVVKEIERIDGLVERLRSLASPSPAAALPVDIREPLLETVALLRAQCEQSRTTVRRELDASPLLVAVDPSLLKQLFLNLCLNAIEAMGPGGELTVKAHQRFRQGVPWVTVEVLDSGTGISDSIRSKIFDPFFTTKSRGSGLGLAICHNIADAHRGTIRAENNKGKGASLIVEFPAAQEVPQFAHSESVLGKG
jgi:signal transduction histidine kinase